MILIRNLQSDDLRAVTAIHRRAFDKSALTKLGAEAVYRYYDWQLTGPHDAVALGAWVEGHLAGFCFGGSFRGATGGFLAKNRSFLIRRVALRPWLLSNELFRARLTFALRALRLRSSERKREPAQLAEPDAPSFGILAIASDPSSRKRGVGRALMCVSECIASERGFRQMQLTVHPSNTTAVAFYEGLGWRKHPAGAAWEGKMVKPLKETT